MKTILEINQLKVKYGPIEAVKGISLKVEEGQIVALLGANGAGKSTIIKTIGGLNKVSEGSILLEGKSINDLPPYKINAAGVMTSPEGRLVFKELTVEENLMVGAYSLKKKTISVTDEKGDVSQSTLSRKTLVADNLKRVYSYFPILHERRKQRASTLSGGEQQMLAIGRALMGSPKLLLLDEPSLGLAPLIVKDIFEIIKTIAHEGTTILIVEQNAFQTLKIANYAYLVELGKIKAEGEPSVLLKDNKLISAYLGGQKKEDKI